ncbi:MAG: HAD-IIIC family phosphatase [Nitrospirota bacterium]|jgi:FkbH-like protein
MSNVAAEQIAQAKAEKQGVKCVVWDLDNTLWDGVLLEDGDVRLRDGAEAVIEELDRRGILQSVASKNDHHAARERLEELGLWEYFLYPQINWNPKSSSIQRIVEAINIGMDTVAFVDDQSFERDEVAFALPDVMCIDAAQLADIPEMKRMVPRFITPDSKLRRQMYMSDIVRQEAESDYRGTDEEFLSTLGLEFRIRRARQDDLQRAEELTVRTHQLNTTGYTYSYDDLDRIRTSDDHVLLVASLDDRYGTYGKIGLALVEKEEERGIWNLKLLLMSCRVMSRGVGTIMLNHIMRLARDAGVRLRAEFVHNGRNRMMYVTYKFANFKELDQDGELVILDNDLSVVQGFPEYVSVEIES